MYTPYTRLRFHKYQSLMADTVSIPGVSSTVNVDDIPIPSEAVGSTGIHFSTRNGYNTGREGQR